jgi:hypothetical protein
MASTITDGCTLLLASPNEYAQGADWEQQRNRITRLYVEENRTLKDVKAFMEQQLGFRAM